MAMSIDVLEAALIVGLGAGIVIASLGIFHSRVSSLALGACVVSYSLTGLTYIPLLYQPASPLSVMDRMWGAMTAVLAGAALVGVVMAALLGEDTSRAGRVRTWAMVTTMFALLSLAGIYFSLRAYSQLPPSTDFLNDYAHLTGVVIYQCIFAVWIAFPAGALGVSNVRARQLGWPRWLVFAGGMSGVCWGVWKITGVLWNRVLDEHIRLESPVSVTLGLIALVLCVAGLIMVGVRGRRELRTDRAHYIRRRSLEDASFKAGRGDHITVD